MSKLSHIHCVCIEGGGGKRGRENGAVHGKSWDLGVWRQKLECSASSKNFNYLRTTGRGGGTKIY